MAKMIIMQGLPASGKSTEAKRLVETSGEIIRINKDLIRSMLHFGKFTFRNEEKTRAMARLMALHFLSNGVSVIIDDTNLNPKTLQSWVDMAKGTKSKIQHVRMLTTVEECIERDKNRKDSVGEHVILKMALQWQQYGLGKDTVICDLDGTLCDISHRLHHVKGEKKDWDSFFAGISGDEVRTEVLDSIMKLEAEGKQIIFVSARPEEYREATEAWIEKKFKGYRPHLTLIMRENGDKRDDVIVKSEIYDKYLKHLKVVKVFDDRPKVIRMWKEKGLDVVDCGNGQEF